MPTHTLLIVGGSWLLLALMTTVYLVRTRGADGEGE